MKSYFVIGRVILFLIITFIGSGSVFGEGIKTRFKDKEKITYSVFFNGIPSGYIEWEYLGQKEMEGVTVDVLSISSDTAILKLLNLTSKEKVFLDTTTRLPLRVERDIVFFGKKELISEIYNQDEGYVKIERSNSKSTEDILYQDKPIRNILELLYFFPRDAALEPGKWMVFNLPTQKVKIKMVKERELKINGKKFDTYFLVGRGAKRFSLWLDRDEKIPLRLEFISLAGKITILRKPFCRLSAAAEQKGEAK